MAASCSQSKIKALVLSWPHPAIHGYLETCYLVHKVILSLLEEINCLFNKHEFNTHAYQIKLSVDMRVYNNPLQFLHNHSATKDDDSIH